MNTDPVGIPSGSPTDPALWDRGPMWDPEWVPDRPHIVYASPWGHENSERLALKHALPRSATTEAVDALM